MICHNAAGAARVPGDVPVQRDVHRLEPVAAVRRPLPHPRARRQLPAAAGLHRPAGGERHAHLRLPQVRLMILDLVTRTSNSANSFYYHFEIWEEGNPQGGIRESPSIWPVISHLTLLALDP